MLKEDMLKLKEDKLYTDTCVVEINENYIKEGVITKKNGKFVNILWCIFDDDYLSQIKSTEEILFIDDIKNLDYAINPHFCKIKNLYSILNKYSNDKTFYLLGVNRLKNTKQKIDSIYLKTKNGIYLEIIVCYREHETEETYVWLNECDSINELHLDYNPSYYFDNTKKTKIKIKEFSHDAIGLDFINNKGNCLTICTSVRTKDRTNFINGMDTNYDVLYETKSRNAFINECLNLY